MPVYRVGIIGFGWVAEAHLLSFIRLANFEPVAILSTRKLDPKFFNEKYGVNIKIYNDLILVIIKGG